MKALIHIVPSYLPIRGGVADFCDSIVRNLKGYNHYVISYHQNIIFNCTNNAEIKNNKAFDLSKLLSQTIDQIDKNTEVEVMLHYVSYGYHKLGIPSYLYNDLLPYYKKLKIITFFHEIYSLGNKTPWQTSFWCKPIQKKTIRNLLSISTLVFTNNELYKSKLRELNNSQEAIYQPVFSNVGELNSISNNKKNHLIIFGGKGLKSNLTNQLSIVEKKLLNYKFDEIYNIGGLINTKKINDKTIIDLGYLDKNDVSKKLEEATFGLLSYKNMPVEKSGVFSAYLAHGVIPILIDAKITNKELKKLINTHHLNTESLLNWYKSNASLNLFCERFEELLQ